MNSGRLARLEEAARNTWLFPRRIGAMYMRPAMARAREYATGTMLDVGCGFCPYETIFAGRVRSYIGLDWPVSAQKARPNVIGDAMSIPVRDGAVHTVLATELMEHLSDPDEFLREVSRVLYPSGTLILSAPFLEPLHEEPRDYFRFTPYGLRVLLARHGFCVEAQWAKGGWWSVVLGYLVQHALYDLVNPMDGDERRGTMLRKALVLPVCAAAQWLGYNLDRIFHSTRYSLGYVVVARRGGGSPPEPSPAGHSGGA